MKMKIEKRVYDILYNLGKKFTKKYDLDQKGYTEVVIVNAKSDLYNDFVNNKERYKEAENLEALLYVAFRNRINTGLRNEYRKYKNKDDITGIDLNNDILVENETDKRNIEKYKNKSTYEYNQQRELNKLIEFRKLLKGKTEIKLLDYMIEHKGEFYQPKDICNYLNIKLNNYYVVLNKIKKIIDKNKHIVGDWN